MASLGILVVLLGVLSQLLYTGGRMWLKTDYAYQKQHQLQELDTVIGGELHLAYSGDFLPEAALRGDEQELAFWRETSRGFEQVTYRYDPAQQILYRAAGFWGSKPEEQVFLRSYTRWKFEYFDAASGNWKLQWRSEAKSMLPSLVRVTAATSPLGEITTVIALDAWHEEVKP